MTTEMKRMRREYFWYSVWDALTVLGFAWLILIVVALSGLVVLSAGYLTVQVFNAAVGAVIQNWGGAW